MESINNETLKSIGRLEGKMDMLVASMSGLAQSFDNLEKGRLSRLEIAFASLQAEAKQDARHISSWTSSIISVIISVISALIIYFLTK